jgi:DMSO/TMAO reductase YedYZ molybdopterin-dependent catalytic subunit
MRSTRRRRLVVGGAVAASFPTLNVEPPPDVPAEDWVLKVDGLVERPFTVGRAAWSELERREVTADFHCVTGWTAEDVRWGGVAPSVLLERAGLLPGAGYAAFHAVRHLGGGYLSSLPLDLVTAPDAILADVLDGGPLPAEHGGPLRLVVPRQLGYKSVKWVVRIEITAESVPGYWEQRGYPDDAPVRDG